MAGRARSLQSLLGAPVSGALVALMAAGCLLLWVGVPLLWIWIGSQVQASASVAAALGVTMAGAVVTIIAVAAGLAWLNRKHVEWREARELPIGRYSALEVMLVISAAIALTGFCVWFFGFSGSSPVPLNLRY